MVEMTTSGRWSLARELPIKAWSGKILVKQSVTIMVSIIEEPRCDKKIGSLF